MSTPNKTVAERIVAALETEDILLPASSKGLVDKLATGKVGSSDWIMIFGLDHKTRKQNAEDQTKKH